MGIWPIKPSTPGPYPKPKSCIACPLSGNGKGFGFASLGGSNGVMLVGDHLTQHDLAQGEFFTGNNGWQFNHVLKRGGFRREDFTAIDGVLHCRPAGDKLDWRGSAQQAIRQCSPFLEDTIKQTQPRAIVALGGTALQRLTGQTGIQRHRGFIHDSPYGIPVVGTFHPSFLLPKRKEKAASKYTWVMIMDIRKALRIAEGKREFYGQQYLLDPSPDRAEAFMNEWLQTPGDDVWMGWDLETLYKAKAKNEQELKLEGAQPVTRISYSFRPGYAMTIPWTSAYMDRIIKPIFAMNRPKVGHNSRGFDEPIIQFQEHMEINGDRHDCMDLFHVFQPNLERNLEFVTSLLSDHLQPWKHLNQAEPERYSAQDSDATITNAYKLREIMRSREIPEYL